MFSCFGKSVKMSAGSKESDRCFANLFPDYSGETLLDEHGKIFKSLSDKLASNIAKLCDVLESGIAQSDSRDYSVYTGSCGIALLYLDMYLASNDTSHLQKSLGCVQPCLSRLAGKRVTFACGDAGPLAVAAVVYHKLGQDKESRDCIARLQGLLRLTTSPDCCDEFLYGRVGYLFSLLFVQHHLGMGTIDAKTIAKVYDAVIDSGQTLSRQQRCKPPLMYEWHDKKYLGAAHGMTGIMFSLMQVPLSQINSPQDTLIKNTVDYLLTLQFPSGNFPSSIGSATGDKLVHWCHGAPGWVHMLLKAHQKFGDDCYLEKASQCGDVLWERGLLKKGYGLCHGTAGNGFGFLALYRQTKELKYLYRAIKFAEWCFDYGTHGCREADRPYSLFEGLAGTIHFLVDMQDPVHAKFPGYEL